MHYFKAKQNQTLTVHYPKVKAVPSVLYFAYSVKEISFTKCNLLYEITQAPLELQLSTFVHHLPILFYKIFHYLNKTLISQHLFRK